MRSTSLVCWLAVGPIFFVCTFTLAAQCIVNNPGGSKVNPNRPSESDTPEAVFSPLSEVNRQLPDWMCFTLGYRTRFEGYSGNNFLPHASDSYLLTRFRLGLLVKPATRFKVYAELQDADAFLKNQPLAPPYQETWDLRRAYVEIGDIQEGHFGLRVGRQDLNFGDGRLVGTSYWRNASRGFDAVQAVTNWAWFSTTAFAASQVVVGDNGLSHHQPGNNLYGLDGKLSKLIPKATLEPFIFWRLTPGVKTEEGAPGRLDEKTVGLRSAGTIFNGWDYDVEGARQFGSLGADRVRAWAWMGIAGYTFTNLRFKARLFGEYDFASGDGNSKDHVRGTFDQLFPNVHDHLGLADQFAWQNLKAVRAGARIWLRRNWIVAPIWNNYWLANATDGYYNSSGAIVARDPRGLSGSHIGEEYDIQTSYRFDRNLEFGAGFARVLPGEFLLKTRHPASYSYPYFMMSYNFF
jgi:hypothetical protein